MKTKNEYLGIGSLLLATFLYGFFGIMSRLIGFSIPLFYQTSLRSLVAGTVILILLLLSKQWKSISKSDFLWVFIRSIFGLVSISTFFIAVNNLTLGNVYFIFYAGSTIGGYCIGYALFKEKLTKIKIASLLLSVCGLFFIYSLSINPENLIYALLSLIAGLSSSIWVIFPKKISTVYSALQLAFLDNILCVVIGLLISLCVKEIWVIPTISTPWVVNFIFGLVYIVTGQLVIFGFKYLEAQIGSLVMLTEVLFSIILGFLFYRETISFYSLIGGIFILIAIIMPEIINRFKLKGTFAKK